MAVLDRPHYLLEDKLCLLFIQSSRWKLLSIYRKKYFQIVAQAYCSSVLDYEIDFARRLDRIEKSNYVGVIKNL